MWPSNISYLRKYTYRYLWRCPVFHVPEIEHFLWKVPFYTEAHQRNILIPSSWWSKHGCEMLNGVFSNPRNQPNKNNFTNLNGTKSTISYKNFTILLFLLFALWCGLNNLVNLQLSERPSQPCHGLILHFCHVFGFLIDSYLQVVKI